MGRCEVCDRIIGVEGETFCSEKCAVEFTEVGAIRGRFFGLTTFKSTLGKFADALAEHRRARLATIAQTKFDPTIESQERRAKILRESGDSQVALLKAAFAIGEMMAKVKTPAGSGGSPAEGESVKRAVSYSFPRWIDQLGLTEPSYPNDYFAALAEAIAPFFGPGLGRTSIDETFRNILAELKNYSQSDLNTASEKALRKTFIKGVEAQGAFLDEQYKKYSDNLKGKEPKSRR